VERHHGTGRCCPACNLHFNPHRDCFLR
jgi:hypothetical protein